MAKIPIKNAIAVEKMRRAGAAASRVLQQLLSKVKPGITTGELDQLCAELIAAEGGRSAFHGYRGFPGQACISVNEEVVHGIGGQRILNSGDIVSIDVGLVKDGWIGDNASTVPVGDVTTEVSDLLRETEESLYRAIDQVREGVRLGEVCAAVEAHIRPHGYGVVREFVGHGVGKSLHEEPQVPNFRPAGRTPRLRAGMVLAIEPMVNLGTAKILMLEDGWTVVSKDRSPSAHFEHTVLVTHNGHEILTDRPRIFQPA